MKKFIVFVLVLVATTLYADGLKIKIKNNTGHLAVVRLHNIDHNVKINGRLYPFPMMVCVAELKAGEEFNLSTRSHNKPPYRYIVHWTTYDKNHRKIKSWRYVIKIPPEKSFYCIE